MKKNKLVGYVFLLGLLIAACQPQSKLERIEMEAKEFTAEQCPKMVDAYTRMDSTVFDRKLLTYVYSYTVSDSLDKHTLFSGTTQEAVHNALLMEIKSSIELKDFKDEGLTLSYRYFSESTGRLLGEFVFTKEDYTLRP